MLLGLDEDNHQHSGASESQINILPESVIQVLYGSLFYIQYKHFN